jgi:hypothetical protein
VTQRNAIFFMFSLDSFNLTETLDSFGMEFPSARCLYQFASHSNGLFALFINLRRIKRSEKNVFRAQLLLWCNKTLALFRFSSQKLLNKIEISIGREWVSEREWDKSLLCQHMLGNQTYLDAYLRLFSFVPLKIWWLTIIVRCEDVQCQIRRTLQSPIKIFRPLRLDPNLYERK